MKITKLPSNIEEFVQLRDEIANTPEGGATIFLLALKIYAENPEFGKQCFVVAADRNRLTSGNAYKGYELSRADFSLIESQLKRNKRIPNSYIKGTKTENNYEVNLPYEYEFSSNPYSGDPKTGKYKLFVKCSGADSDRPIHVTKNNRGIWKASNWSSVVVGIKKPQIDDDI